MTPAEADRLLDEWARWQAGDCVNIGYPRSTPFGRLIKPDPSPSRLPIDVERALRTDRAVAKLTGKRRFMVKVHYLDTGPIDAKARRMHVGRKEYLSRITGICGIIAQLLDPSRKIVANPNAEMVYKQQSSRIPPNVSSAMR